MTLRQLGAPNRGAGLPRGSETTWAGEGNPRAAGAIGGRPGDDPASRRYHGDLYREGPRRQAAQIDRGRELTSLALDHANLGMVQEHDCLHVGDARVAADVDDEVAF